MATNSAPQGSRPRETATVLPDPPPRTPAEWLLHPAILRSLRAAAPGQLRPAPPARTRVTLEWDAKTRADLQDFLDTQDLAKLSRVLRADWRAVAHPVILGQLSHLRSLLQRPAAEDLAQGFALVADSEEDILPVGTRAAALDALRALVTAWATAVLRGHRFPYCPPGWAILRDRNQIVIRPRRRRGRPTGVDWEAAATILWQVQEIKEAVRTVHRLNPLLFRQTGKNARFSAALTLVKQVYERLPWPREPVAGSSLPATHPFRFAEVRLHQRPLPPADAETLARLALATRRPIARKKLIVALLAYEWYGRRTPTWEKRYDTVRGQWDAAQGLAQADPDLLPLG